MCVIFIAYQKHPKYPLIVLANRDEFYDRPTAPAARWEDQPEIIAGRDLVAGGTWLGVTEGGRFGAVTNFRGPSAPLGNVSRGRLVSNFLSSVMPPEEYLGQLAMHAGDFSGFNLVVGEINKITDKVLYYSNRGKGIVRLEPGLHGISNHLLNTPWPKVARGMEEFEKLLARDSVSLESCFDLLKDETIATEELLPDTGIGAEREKLLSPIFIRTPKYGTRCSTIITINNELKVDLRERIFV